MRTPTVQSAGEANVPPGAPGWITPELVDDTIQTWGPYYIDPLTADDALEILLSVGNLIDLLEVSP